MRFYALLIFVAPVVSVQRANDNVSPKELPDCSKVSASGESARTSTSPRELFIVSTLDGKISALDPSENGNLVWSHETGPNGLMSSSLSKLEVRNRGRWVRLIPSLDGSLYKFTGDTVEPIPMTADLLLKSSFKLGDDLVITGGKESRTYGIDLHTGQVRYVCTINGCNQTEIEDSDAVDILVVKRNSQTVRAIEPRTGREKWNFSVGEHELSVLRSLLGGCQPDAAAYNNPMRTSEKEGKCLGTDGSCARPQSYIQVVVPEGLVAARTVAQGVPDWSVKFPSPVVGAWYLRDGELEPVNLFEQGHIIGLQGTDHTSVDPILYIGVHDKQLYVQHNAQLKRELTASSTKPFNGLALPRVEWKPYLASAPSRTPIINTGRSVPPLLEDSRDSVPGKSLILRDDVVDYPFDTGYYLYESPDLDNISTDHILCDEEKEEETLDHYIIVSIWYWWKEVLIISVTMSLLVNLLITRHVLHRWKQNFLQESSSSNDKTATSSLVTEYTTLSAPVNEGISAVEKHCGTNELPRFESRYLSDFDPIRCLGKGGFGLVLESRNKIDDCTYAVKRICLPNSPEARDKVMREAKALAKLDHMGIVRYYNAWLESPPPGWQEHQDDVWQSSFDHWSNSTYSELDKASGAASPSSVGGTRSFCPLKPSGVGLDSTSSGVTMDPSLTSARGLPFQSYSLQNPEDTDSFVRFENSEGEVEKAEEDDTSSSSGGDARRKRPNSLSLDKSVPPQKVYLYIQMQLCKKESLKEWLSAHSTAREYEAVLDIFYQIVNAVEYVHEHGLIHRDLKPSNIFFAMDDAIKVGDFGLVTALTGAGGSVPVTPSDCTLSRLQASDSGRLTDQVGTQLYMSPEQIEGLNYNQAVDIFSLGLIFFELLCPFSTQMERIQVLSSAKKLKFPHRFRQDYPAESELIEQLLSQDSGKRPTAKHIKQHCLFQAFHACEETLTQRRRRNKSFNSSSLSE